MGRGQRPGGREEGQDGGADLPAVLLAAQQHRGHEPREHAGERDPARARPGISPSSRCPSRTVAQAALTAFNGKDIFKTGIAIKKGETVWVLNGTEWSVNWNMNVDASMNGAGKAVESAAIKDLIKDGPDPTLKDWSLKPGAGSAFEGFSTVELAMKRSPSELLKWIFAAKTHDPVSYKNICAALDAKAPNLTVNIGVRRPPTATSTPTTSRPRSRRAARSSRRSAAPSSTTASARRSQSAGRTPSAPPRASPRARASASSSTSPTKATAETPAITFPFTGTHNSRAGRRQVRHRCSSG